MPFKFFRRFSLKFLSFLVIISALFASMVILKTPLSFFSRAKVLEVDCGYLGGPGCDTETICGNGLILGFSSKLGLSCLNLEYVCGKGIGTPCCADGSCNRSPEGLKTTCSRFGDSIIADDIKKSGDIDYRIFATYIPPGQIGLPNQSPGYCYQADKPEEHITGAVGQCGDLGQGCCKGQPACYNNIEGVDALCLSNPKGQSPTCQRSTEVKFSLFYDGQIGGSRLNIPISMKDNEINYIKMPMPFVVKPEKRFNVGFRFESSNLTNNYYLIFECPNYPDSKNGSYYQSSILGCHLNFTDLIKPLTFKLRTNEFVFFNNAWQSYDLGHFTIQFYNPKSFIPPESIISPTSSPSKISPTTSTPSQSPTPTSLPLKQGGSAGALNGPCRNAIPRCDPGLHCDFTLTPITCKQ